MHVPTASQVIVEERQEGPASALGVDGMMHKAPPGRRWTVPLPSK
jgi:hypothetical protein